MIKEITQWILDKGLGPPWVRDEDLFCGHVPLRTLSGAKPPERILAVLENAGGAVYGDLPDRVDKAVQIWNRAKTYFTARGDAHEVYDLLHGATGWALDTVDESGFYIMTIDAYGPPAPIENPGKDGLFVFSTNYTFRVENPP